MSTFSPDQIPHSEFRVIEETLRRFFMEEDDADFAEAINALHRIEEQYQTALDRLWEAHDQLCGCDKPADEGRCSAPEETWGAFEYLGERERVSIPAINPDVSERRVDSPSAQGVDRAGRAGPLPGLSASVTSDLPRSETSDSAPASEPKEGHAGR